MQGVIAGITLMVNVFVLGIIIKRSIEQKRNPYKQEIFRDQKDFQLALARAEKVMLSPDMGWIRLYPHW